MTEPASSVSLLDVGDSTFDVGRSSRCHRLVVISPEAEDAREQTVVAQLFAAGLTDYHLRKPSWPRARLAAWLRALPAGFHPRIVLHTHHDLASEFPLAGLHDRDEPNSICHLISDKNSCEEATLVRSRAIHDVTTLRTVLDSCDRLLVSPLFPSFSKPGYGPSSRFPEAELRAALALPRRAEAIALGGIDASRIPACRELGFDGVAVLGAVWQAADPLRVFTELKNALHNHAA